MPGVVADFLKRPRRNLDRPLTEGTVIGERVRASSAASQIAFLPYLDAYTAETETIRRAYREMLKAPVVKAALLGKIYAVASLDLQIHPADDENPRDQDIADFVHYAYTQALGHVEVDSEANRVHAATEGGFAQLCETVLLPGLIDKFSVSNKVWYKELWPRGKFTGKRFYRGLKAKDGCQLEQDEFRNIIGVVSHRFGTGTHAVGAGASVKQGIVAGGAVGPGKEPPEDPRDFVIFRNMPLFEGSGMSDFRAAYGAYWRLDTVEKIRVIHLEKFTSPHMVGEYKPGATQEETDANRLELATELEKAKSRNWTVLPEGVKWQAISLATRGEKEFEDACRSYREDIALAIAGAFLQMLTAQGGGGEMRGDAKTQRSTSELFVWHLAARMTAIIDRQLTPDLVDMNFGAGADYPTSSLGGINYADLKAGIELDRIAQSMGAKLSTKAFAKKYALQLASDPADVLTVPQAAPPIGGIGGGGGFFAQPAVAAAAPSKEQFTEPSPPSTAPVTPPAPPAKIVGDVAGHYSRLATQYGDDAARAVMQATAALLGGGGGSGTAGHAFTEPRREPPSQPQPQPPAVINVQPQYITHPPPPPPTKMFREVTYDSEGRITGTIDTPVPMCGDARCISVCGNYGFCGGPGSGVPGPCPSGVKADAVAGEKSRTIMQRLRNMPAAVATKVKGKVAATYAKLSERYGPKYAKAIVAAGLIGLPLPIPGSSFLTAAPVLAMAELHLQFSKPRPGTAGEMDDGALDASAPGGLTLTDDEVQELGRMLVAELYAEFGVTLPDGSPVDASHELCGGPGSGRPGPCPSGISDTPAVGGGAARSTTDIYDGIPEGKTTYKDIDEHVAALRGKSKTEIAKVAKEVHVTPRAGDTRESLLQRIKLSMQHRLVARERTSYGRPLGDLGR